MKVDKCDATDLRDIADHLELHGHYAFVPAMLRKAADRLDELEGLLLRARSEMIFELYEALEGLDKLIAGAMERNK